jgi:hypothetical protein
MNDQQVQKIKEEMLAVFYKYTPQTTAALISLITGNWGSILDHNGTLLDYRWVDDEFCKKLAGYIDSYQLTPAKKKGRVKLHIKEIDLQARSWGEKWSRIPYPEAIDSFVEIVYRWLSTVELRDVIKDKSPNQLVYYWR